jgi:two-component sensor histidine kinase
MTVPYLADTRQSYVQRMANNHLHIAEVHHKIGNNRSMWLSLLYYAMAEDVYGEHWDYVNRLKEKA